MATTSSSGSPPHPATALRPATDFHLRCSECQATFPGRADLLVCPQCRALQRPGREIRGILEVVLPNLPGRWPAVDAEGRRVFDDFLPLGASAQVPSLGVGNTPLLSAPRLRASLETPRLTLKDETRNPSGSIKDRASQLVVTKALEGGFRTIAAASTGNAATALAALGAAAGVRTVVFVPAAAPRAKLIQMLVYGACVVRVSGSYDQAFELCWQACETFGWYNRNTALNPFTVEGKKTAALEIAAQLAPEEADAVFVPTGDGVVLSGIAKGFADLEACGLIRRRPRLFAVQPEGSAAIAQALQRQPPTLEPLAEAVSVADSLQVEAPRGGLLCLRAIQESKGRALVVPDRDTLRAIHELATSTGVFAEPAAAIALAGLQQALSAGLVDPEERIVLLITGTGLKDVPAATQGVELPPPIAPELDAVLDLQQGWNDG